MRRWFWLLVVMGCGGDKTSDSGATAGDDDDDDIVIECNLPSYDLPTLSCDALAGAWRDTVEAGNSCNTAADCVVLRAPCETWWQVSCFYATNASCLDQTDLATFSAESGGCNIDGDACACSGSPEPTCVDHECAVGDTTR